MTKLDFYYAVYLHYKKLNHIFAQELKFISNNQINIFIYASKQISEFTLQNH